MKEANSNKKVLAFDIYGTLINTSAVLDLVKDHTKEHAQSVVDLWRSKQLEYSFRQQAMGIYKGFSFCTRAALDYACATYGLNLSEADKSHLLKSYETLDAFLDVLPSLDALKQKGIALYAFSNGEREQLERLFQHNGMAEYFDQMVSVEEVQQFKPSPDVYQHFNQVTKTQKEHTILVSSNPFDILGAANYGFGTIWVKRSEKAIMDSWGIEPDHIVSSLHEIVETIGDDISRRRL